MVTGIYAGGAGTVVIAVAVGEAAGEKLWWRDAATARLQAHRRELEKYISCPLFPTLPLNSSQSFPVT